MGDSADSAEWLVKKFGDVYLHETVISHIRRLLDGEFVHNKLHESPDHFMHRMQQVENHMNFFAFAACGGLARELRSRCEELKRQKGERLPK